MASYLDFRLNIDTKDAEKSVDNVNKDLEKTADLAELQLVLESADAASSVKELNEAMEKLQSQALKFGQGSDEFIKAATKAGQLKKRMDDVNRSIDTVASGGQLGQITGAFERLKVSAQTFDVEGVATAFGLMKTQIAGAATAALGLGQGLSVATVAARGLAVALAATGITIIIAAVVLLISEFENLADAGGLVGTIFTGLGNIMSSVREAALELLDSLGLIDLKAKQAAESQQEYLKNLEDEFAANSDAYDELTRKKTQAEIDYLKSLEEINNRRDISEQRKNQLIELYNKKRIRAIETAEKEAVKAREDAAEKERLRIKKEATEAEARSIAEIQRERDKLQTISDLRIDEIRTSGLKEIKEIYKLEAEKVVTEQQQINRSAEIRRKTQGEELKELYRYRKEMRAKGYNDEVKEFRDNQKKILDLEVAYIGSNALITRKKILDEERKTLEARAREIAQYRLNESIADQNFLNDSIENEIVIYSEYERRRMALIEAYNQRRIVNQDALEQLLIMNYNDYLKELAISREGAALSEATRDMNLAELKLYNAQQEKSAYFEMVDAKLKANRKAFEEQKITAKEYTDEEKRLMEEAATERIRLEQEVVDADIAMKEAGKARLQAYTDFEISEAQRAQQAKIEAYNEFAGNVQNVTGFISDQLAAISNIQQQFHQQRLFEIDEEYTAQYNSLQAQYQQGLITEVALSNGLAQIEEQRRKAKYKADKKAFEQEKAIRITQAVMSTIQATLAAYSSGAAIPVIGTVMGPVFAAIAAAFGAVQVGLIAAEKFPSYQSAASSNANISVPSPTTPSAAASGAANVVPPSFYANSGAVQGSDAMLNPGGIYQAPSGMGGQVFVLESDITATQNQVAVTEDRSYFDAGSYG